jgi:hypothetical protein
MTEDELQAIEARATAATPGPWTTGAGKVEGGQVRELVIGPGPRDDVIVAIAYGGFGNPVDRTSEDRAFIAAARTDVPKLITEVRRLKALCAKAYERVRFLDDMGVGGEGWQSPELSDIVASLGAIARDEDE